MQGFGLIEKTPKKMFRKRLDAYADIEIFEGFPFNHYIVSETGLSPKEKTIAGALIQLASRKSSFGDLETALGKNSSLVEDIRRKIVQPIDAEEMILRFPSTESAASIKNSLFEIAKKFGSENPELFSQEVTDETIGFKKLSPLMRDPNLEEIMVNGFNRTVFVFHRKFGFCRTNIVAKETGFLKDLIERIASSANKQLTEQHPLLDARLPDGSRANATLEYVTPLGHSLTIRKFNQVPLSISDIVANKTVSSEVAAFLWLMVEGMNIEPKNIIITGGTGSGKTTLLNVLGFFIRAHERIVSIEDTLEIDLAGRENWIQMESRPKLRDIAEVTMDDLLKNSLRMRPDRLLVGEVRDEAAQTLFVAMDTGHDGILGTLHSNSAREMLLRLKSPPMSVPEQMLPLLDFVVVMQRNYNDKTGVTRSIKQIAEVSRMDDKVLLANVFELNDKTGLLERTDIPSHVFETLAQKSGISKNELKRELLVRQKIIDWLQIQKIHSNKEVSEIIQMYYYDPEAILKKVSGSL
ncbi:MAG: ATPase, T2SS/T4P/T4SS family [Candidatus ainarchaeum sp.]|nr:ATPase, T2SS/T4P/T4SS family [Candidatus ainarchaeum sp.]